MIRTAVLSDLSGIDASYRMHFRHEEEHDAFTLFREGVYPTAAIARDAIGRGALAVYESGNEILGSIICDGEQPEEYAALRLDTGMQNVPARSLYEKVDFGLHRPGRCESAG